MDFLELVDIEFSSRLHGHAIFGVVSVSDTCRTPERVRLAGFRCPASVLFFFFFLVSPTRADAAPTQLRRGFDASDTPAMKKKRKFRHISGHSGHSGQFRPKWKFRPIQDFDWKKKKSKSKSYLLLLGFVLYFLIIFFLISVSSSSSSFGFGLVPDYLFFFICVCWLSSTCV